MKWITRDRSYYRSLLTLAIPVALQNLITFLVSFADNLMVNKLGDAAVSGVYMGNQMQTFIQMFTAGISGAILIISAQYWGRKGEEQIRSITAIGLRIAALVGLILAAVCFFLSSEIIALFTDDAAVISEGAIYLRFVCLSYPFFCITQALIASMRSVEITKIGMSVSLLSLFVNIFLNYVLIFGKLGFPAMGVKGAAIATLLSRVVETAAIGAYVFLYDKRLAFRFRHILAANKPLTRSFIKYGLPLTAGEIVWAVNMMCNSRILGGYGAPVITAASVINTLNTLAYITITGLASAVGIITGKTIGAGKRELMKEYARTTQIIFMFVGLFSGALVYLISTPFINLYSGISPEAAEQSMRFARVLSVTIIGTGYQMPCLFGLVKSGGDIGFVFKNDTIFVFLIVLPSAIIAAHFGAPAWVTFACLKCDQILKCVVAAVKINRFNWMKDLTRA
ncbi:MAG: MATE family efflux transporter [Eubacteriales bacterium]|nr:MATE family efflux transporter [Eubacteriales bacterium]MDD3881975.1 MATE family efflux transporter [Eubacteriales bacterium]MDD4513124.1 MATE family efflux transporter [Eubacteriales bacterium]